MTPADLVPPLDAIPTFVVGIVVGYASALLWHAQRIATAKAMSTKSEALLVKAQAVLDEVRVRSAEVDGRLKAADELLDRVDAHCTSTLDP